MGVVLYDADRIYSTASVASEQDVYPALLEIILDPNDPEIRKKAESDGIEANMIEATIRSPVYKLTKSWKLAFPLHPEYRTLPMVWYIPPLSPMSQYATLSQEEDIVDHLRIPVTYLANLITAGDEAPVRLALKRLSAIRRYMRSVRVEKKIDNHTLESVGLTKKSVEEIYRLLALARIEERFVVPTASSKKEHIFIKQGQCGYSDLA